MHRLSIHAMLFSIAVLFGASTTAVSQSSYPSRTVRLVVPFPAGGTADIVARIAASAMGNELKQNVIVENMSGASTAIGTAAVARADKDGHTLLFTAATTFVTNPHLYDKLPYKLEDFEPVALVAKVPFAFVVKKDFRARTVAEFREYAKANPGEINNATNGPGSVVHLIGEMIAKQLGIEMKHVHYRGASPATNDLLAGVIDSNVEALTNAVPNVTTGQYRALAVLTSERSPQLPDVPTFKELGYPELIAESWFAVFAPAGTPAEITQKLSDILTRMVQSADFIQRMREIGNEAAAARPQELLKYVNEENARWGKIIKEAGIQLN
jgi:tripartite-type tricarboxylate transporter receptor subunit TctC